MKLENEVPQLKYCKRLEELGYNSAGLYRWMENPKVGKSQVISTVEPCSEVKKWHEVDKIDEELENTYHLAPTLAEMGEWLPGSITTDIKEYWLNITKPSNQLGLWRVRYTNTIGKGSYSVEHGKTETDARAKMLIYLAKSKYIKF